LQAAGLEKEKKGKKTDVAVFHGRISGRRMDPPIAPRIPGVGRLIPGDGVQPVVVCGGPYRR